MEEKRYLFKTPGGPWEFRLYPKNIDEFLPSKFLEQEVTDYIDYRYLGHNLYIYFDDEGVKQHTQGKLKYNFNIPSGTKEFQNQIFGNVIIEKVDPNDGYPVGVSKEDLDYIIKLIFQVPEEQYYTLDNMNVKWIIKEIK